jgi:hypothetical protein
MNKVQKDALFALVCTYHLCCPQIRRLRCSDISVASRSMDIKTKRGVKTCSNYSSFSPILDLHRQILRESGDPNHLLLDFTSLTLNNTFKKLHQGQTIKQYVSTQI